MRKSRIELLRIISMLMIVCLHYLSKGGALVSPAGELGLNGYLAWLVEAFCLVAVNVYVLISGYFSSAGSATVKKTQKLWTQVWFYSVVIGVVAFLFGQRYNVYELMQLLFPTVTEHYWFATSFLLLSLIAPLLQLGAEKIDKKSFLWILVGFLLFSSVAKTILPMQLPWDKLGYDLIWFVTVYLTGMYLKKYGIPERMQNKNRMLFLYLISELIIFISMLLVRQIYLHTGKLEAFITYGYAYNYFFCYTGAIGFFLFFLQGREPKESLQPVIHKLGGATFGVYLIHEHVTLRYVWPAWFQCSTMIEKQPLLFIIHMIVTVFTVYLVCTAIELLRQKIWSIRK